MVKVISLPYIFLALYVLCFTRPRYQVSVYRTIGPLFYIFILVYREASLKWKCLVSDFHKSIILR